MSRHLSDRHTISATEAKNRFGTMLRRVARDDTPLIVERAGKPIAVLMSFAGFQATQEDSSTPSKTRLQLAREAFGMWADRKDIDDDWLRKGREQWYSRWPEEHA